MLIEDIPRASGKTRLAAAWAAGDPEHRVIVVPHWVNAEYLTAVLVEEFRLDPRDATRCVVTADEAAMFVRGRETEVELWVDDVDIVLFELLGRRTVAHGAYSSRMTVESGA